MKYLALTVSAIALIALPATVMADSQTGKTETIYKYPTVQKLRTSEATAPGKDMNRSYKGSPGVSHEHSYSSGNYKLNNGETLQVNKAIAKFISPDGSTYYAPSGEYMTSKGQTFFIKDGLVTGFLSHPVNNVIMLDSDVDNDGIHFERNENNVRVR